MRRLTASLLVAFFSLALISPALFASSPDSKLPACCRRSGQHHCTSVNPEDSASGPALLQGRCSAYPSTPSVPASRTTGLIKVSQAVFAALVSHPSSRPQTESLCRISQGRAGLKRGPPVV
jgi:hypothetical protein